MKAPQLVYLLGGVLIAIAIRQCDVPGQLSRLAYYDLVECREHLLGNSRADRPYWSTRGLLALGGLKVATGLVFLTDLAAAWLLGDVRYLIGCSFFPADISSLVNLLGVIGYLSGQNPRRFSRICSGVLTLISLEFTGASYLPGVNPYWYLNLQMLPQFRKMHVQILLATHLMFIMLAHQAQTVPARMFLMFLFKECGYKGYFLIWWLLSREAGQLSPPVAKLFRVFKNLSIVLCITEHLVWIMIVWYGVGNMNFLCWNTLVFLLTTTGGVIIHEVTANSRQSRANLNRNQNLKVKAK